MATHDQEFVGPRAERSLPRRIAFGFAIAVGVPGAVYLVGMTMFFRSFVAPTGGMENAMRAGDWVLVSRGWTPERNTVIAFEFPGSRDEVAPKQFQYYMQRCVALPGDVVEIRDTTLYLNGRPQPNPSSVKHEDMIDPRPGDAAYTFPPGRGFTSRAWGPMRVPKTGDVIPMNDSTIGMYRMFIMREGHTVEETGGGIVIDGNPENAYTVQRDYCLGLGDNRWNSLDSRYWGFIPVENVAGTAKLISWSEDMDGSVRWDRIFTTVE